MDPEHRIITRPDCIMMFIKILVSVVSDRCEEGFVSTYLQGKDNTEIQPDHVFCGSALPLDIASFNPRLLLVFSSVGAHYAGRGFKAHFEFLTGTVNRIDANL